MKIKKITLEFEFINVHERAPHIPDGSGFSEMLYFFAEGVWKRGQYAGNGQFVEFPDEYWFLGSEVDYWMQYFEIPAPYLL